MRKLLLALTALVLAAAQSATGATGDRREEFSAQRRPHVTIYPRHRALSPNAKRYCRFWLAREYRVSGPVIVPAQYCWWH
jgi:hypothetical protein